MNTILRDLPVTEKQERRLEYTSLWQSRWLLGCLIALLALEWCIRKLGNMA